MAWFKDSVFWVAKELPTRPCPSGGRCRGATEGGAVCPLFLLPSLVPCLFYIFEIVEENICFFG